MHPPPSAHPLLHLATGQPVRHADLQAWAAGALRQIAHGADAAAALRLDRAQRVRQRDRHLHTAWLLLASGGDSDWQVAAKLEKAISRYECGMHQRYLAGADIEPGNELDAALHSAFCCGAGMMRCQRKLYEHFQSTG